MLEDNKIQINTQNIRLKLIRSNITKDTSHKKVVPALPHLIQ